MLSLLFHFTVVPGDTVIEASVKLIFTMLTVLDEGGGAVLLELLPLEHEIKTVENNKLKLTNPVILLMFFIFFILNCERKMIESLLSISTTQRLLRRLRGDRSDSKNCMVEHCDLVPNERTSKMLKIKPGYKRQGKSANYQIQSLTNSECR